MPAVCSLWPTGPSAAPDGSYDQISYAFPAIRCLDSQDASVAAAQKRYSRIYTRRRCSAARWCGPDCPLWPVASGAAPSRRSTGAAPRRSW